MTITPPIQAVLFDMDGVLCDSEALICEAAMRMFEEFYQRSVQPEDFKPFVGTGEMRYVGGVAEKYGIPAEFPRDKERTYDIYLSLIPGRLQPLAGTLDFVAECRRRGLRTAVASSADRRKVEGNLKEIGLPWADFDACVTGSDVTRHKPDPEIFRTAAELVGVPPENCLVLEDAVTGVLAAKAAGCHCLGITSSFDASHLERAGADWTAADLGEAPSVLAWNQGNGET